MKLAAVQYCPPHGRPAQARRELRELVLRAEGADLVVCPEMAISGYIFDSAEHIAPFCEPAAGDTFAMLRDCAQRLGAWVVCGIAERGSDGLYNSALTVSPQGQLVHCYRKVFLYDLDQTWARPGQERPLILTESLGTLSPGICMDLNDDRFGLHLLQNRPDVVPFCTNWVDEGLNILPYWRMRLLGWQGWLVVADRWGQERDVRFYGRSAVLGPRGQVFGPLPAEGDGVLVVDTESRRVEQR